MPPSKQSNLFDPTYLPGSLVKGEAYLEIEDYDLLVAIKEIQLNMQRLERIASITPEEVKKVVEELVAKENVNDLIECATAEVEILEKISKLQKRFRKYKKHHYAETWASRWIASPIAYIFPEERREEWLGDLYEVNSEMLRKEYPLLVINTINVWKALILVFSALQIKLANFLSIASPKKP